MTSEDQDFVLLEDEDLVDYNVDGLLPQPAEEITKIQKWLSPTDYNSASSEISKHKLSYTPGTGEWIQEADQYQQWLRSTEYGTLWIKGVAGSGKSVVAAHVASLFSLTKVPVLHFFFRQIIEANKTPQSLARDWLSQILPISPLLQLNLKDLVKEGRTLEDVSFDDLWELLVSAISTTAETVYCIADALDEMDIWNEHFLQKLAALGRRSPSKIKVFITSRPLPYIEKGMAHSGTIQLVLRPQLVDRDILIYLNTRLDQTALADNTKSEIQDVLGSKSQGLFLYARLMIDDILGSGATDPENISVALQQLPSGLGNMYSRMLNDHSIRSGTPQDLQLLILQCVTHSSRPLRLLELSTVADFVRKSSNNRVFSPPMGLREGTKSVIRNGCGPLLEILEDETVSIIHHSFTEYLIEPKRSQPLDGNVSFPHVERSQTHLVIAKLCVSYLLSEWLPDKVNDNETTDGNLSARLEHPFLDYALHNWTHHVLNYGKSDNELFRLLDRLLEPGSISLSSCLKFTDFGLKDRDAVKHFESISPLHICALKGLTAYSIHLIKLGQEIDGLDFESRTPLHRAAEKGHHGVVEALIQNGAANNMADWAGFTPLHLAASSNNAMAVKALLISGVDPFTPKTREHPGRRCGSAKRTTGMTAVEYASTYGHTEALIEFLPFLDRNGLSKALGWSAPRRRTENVLAILATSKVDVNEKFEDNTPIHSAAHALDVVSMKRLLELGANVSIKSSNIFSDDSVWYRSENYFSPLHAFTRSCRGTVASPLPEVLEGIRLLLEAGCDINEFSSSGLTPLQHAVRSTADYLHQNFCPMEVVEFLLDNGADTSLRATSDGSAILHLADSELESTVDLLVAKGADVNARRISDSRTPLMCATCSGKERTILALIKNGADCNAVDNNGNTALHIVLTNHSPSSAVVNALLANGADPNVRNKEGDMALHVMKSWAGQDFLLPSLLTANMDLEARTTDGLTILLRAVKNNNDLGGIKSLIKAGAQIDTRDFEGRTVLHYCSEKENCIVLFRLLIDMGADPMLRDFDGNTLYHVVARQTPSYHAKEQLELLMILFELGISPNARNHAGQTPFHIAAGRKRSSKTWIPNATDPFQFLLGPTCMADVNASDNKGIRPIHLAATLSEAQVQELLDHGADPLVVTVEGQSVLHVASRTRQCNIVGMMIEIYNEKVPDQSAEPGISPSTSSGASPMVDLIDRDGRTALHYAVRSGRLESVAILLGLGRADPNIKDSMWLSPLDMCMQFRDENARWLASKNKSDSRPYLQASYVALDDTSRPLNCRTDPPSRKNFASTITSEYQSVGIRQIIRLLVQNGADVSFMGLSDLRSPRIGHKTTFEVAIETGCEIMVDELLRVESLNPPKLESGKETSKSMSETDDSSDESDSDDESSFGCSSTWNLFAEKYVALRSQSSVKLLEGIVKPGRSNLATFRTLLQTEDDRGVEEFKNLVRNLLLPQWDGVACMTMLVKWGYASILEKFESEATLVTAEWMAEKDNKNLSGGLRYLLHLACYRSLPNLDVLKALPLSDIDSQAKDGRTALHILAPTTHWWQSLGMEFLLERGANPNIKDTSGMTPLFLAVAGARSERAVEILLRYAADPNIVDNKGLTCLSLAGRNTCVIRQLIKAGANVFAGVKPFIFDAIAALNLEAIQLLREVESDFNVRPIPEKKEDLDKSQDSKSRRKLEKLSISKTVAAMSYAIHYAASLEFNRPISKENMIPIIRELLKGGANPMLSYNEDGDSVLHDIIEHDGIVEPFFEIPNLDLEVRDSKGKTYLLAACSTPNDYFRNHDLEWLRTQPSTAQLLHARGADVAAVDHEGRNIFHHLLKSSVRYSTLRACHSTDFEYFLALPQAATLVVQKDAKGMTPIHHALRGKQLWAIDGLLKNGADPLEVDPEGNTALHHLASHLPSSRYNSDSNSHTTTLFEQFLSFGVSINTPNLAGETPLFSLSLSSGFCMQDLQLFESYGADLMVRDKSKIGLLHIISESGKAPVKKDGVEHPTVILFKYLMSKGLDPMMEDANQRSSLDVAMASGSAGILETFKRDQ
ncbi:hypothetical protein VTL71DRAFT_190 [Oculimacula yallundae]|uniref:Nephrocystin 3-like N-terminal domain-containing protein n=1 Tax=Oculimacula yallundae TaxID=86028 RepID=A0ABR4CZE9_9HELO